MGLLVQESFILSSWSCLYAYQTCTKCFTGQSTFPLSRLDIWYTRWMWGEPKFPMDLFCFKGQFCPWQSFSWKNCPFKSLKNMSKILLEIVFHFFFFLIFHKHSAALLCVCKLFLILKENIISFIASSFYTQMVLFSLGISCILCYRGFADGKIS